MGLNVNLLKKGQRDWAVFSAFLLLAFFLRSTSFFQSVLAWDEGLYLLMARSMIGGELPYIAVWDHKPPGIFILFALAQILLGDSILSIRIVACLSIAITCYLLYRLGSVIGKGGIIGLLAGILYAVFSLNNQGLASNTEIFYVLFVTLAFYLLFTVFPGKPLNRASPRLLLIGFVFGIGLQIQYVVIFDFIAVFIIVGADLYLHHQEIAEHFLASILKAYGMLPIGSVLTLLFVALYFMLNGRFQDYIYANFVANSLYGSTLDFSFADLIPVFRQQVANNALLWICLFLTPLYLIFFREERHRDEKKSVVALLIWSLMAFLGICATGRFYPHYFLHLLPPACLLSAYLVVRVVYSSRKLAPKMRALTLSLILLVPLLQNIYPTLEMGAALVYFRYMQGEEDWGDESAVIAKYLLERVQPDDYIYAVDYAPAIYYLVPAKIPTRYPFPLHLIDEQHSKITGIDPIQELAAIIEKKPVYIMKQYQQNNPFYAQLERYLDMYYVFENSVNDVRLYRLRNDLE